MDWYCYASFEDLQRATEGKKASEEEQEELSKMSQQEKNDWVVEHVIKSKGRYIAVDQGNGYIAFGTFNRFLRGVAEGEVEVEDGGKKEFEMLSPHGGSHGVTIRRAGGNYHVTSWWNNGGSDIGRTSVDIYEGGKISNPHTFNDLHGGDVAYNWEHGQWQESQ